MRVVVVAGTEKGAFLCTSDRNRRSWRDGGDHWEKNEEGLPSWFGFPIAIGDRTKTLFAFPMESDEYRLPVDGTCIAAGMTANRGRDSARDCRWRRLVAAARVHVAAYSQRPCLRRRVTK